MRKTLSNYATVQKWGNSYVIVISDEVKLLKLQPGDLVAFTIRKENPNIIEENTGGETPRKKN